MESWDFPQIVTFEIVPILKTQVSLVDSHMVERGLGSVLGFQWTPAWSLPPVHS